MFIIACEMELTFRGCFPEHFETLFIIFGSLFIELWIFQIQFIFCHFCFYSIKAIYFGQLILPMALTDRHFIAEHFDILFAIFGLVVQKL